MSYRRDALPVPLVKQDSKNGCFSWGPSKVELRRDHLWDLCRMLALLCVCTHLGYLFYQFLDPFLITDGHRRKQTYTDGHRHTQMDTDGHWLSHTHTLTDTEGHWPTDTDAFFLTLSLSLVLFVCVSVCLQTYTCIHNNIHIHTFLFFSLKLQAADLLTETYPNLSFS